METQHTSEKNKAALNDIINALEPLCKSKEDALNIMALIMMSLTDIFNESHARIIVPGHGEVDVTLSSEKDAKKPTEHELGNKMGAVVSALSPHCENHNDSFHFCALALIGLLEALNKENNETIINKVGVVLTWSDKNTKSKKEREREQHWI